MAFFNALAGRFADRLFDDVKFRVDVFLASLKWNALFYLSGAIFSIVGMFSLLLALFFGLAELTRLWQAALWTALINFSLAAITFVAAGKVVPRMTSPERFVHTNGHVNRAAQRAAEHQEQTARREAAGVR